MCINLTRADHITHLCSYYYTGSRLESARSVYLYLDSRPGSVAHRNKATSCDQYPRRNVYGVPSAVNAEAYTC